MSSFTKPLIMSYVDGKKWKLEEKFMYYTKGKEIFLCSLQIKVPKDFVTSFASIPRIFWSIINEDGSLFPPTGKYGKLAVMHDYLYSTGNFKRKICDRILKEAMIILGFPKWKAKLMYFVVRFFRRGKYKRRIKDV